MRALARRSPAAFFFSAAMVVVSACVAVRYTRVFASSPDVAAWGITLDLTVSVPLLYWFFFVRTGKAGMLTIGPLFLLGTLAAKWLLPTAQQEFVGQLARAVAFATPALLCAALLPRVIALRKERRGSSDPYERISAVVRTLVGEGRLAQVVASEVGMMYYAIFGWRQQPEPREQPISFHERHGWGGVVACILLLIVAEGVAMHLLLARWSASAAWAWTVLDAWAIVWFLGDYHALRLRRTWIDDREIHLQYGLRWSMTIPRDSIVSVRAVQQESDWKRRDVLKVAMLEEPRWMIRLREVQVAQGLAGIRKEISAVALLPDDDEWIAELARTIPPENRPETLEPTIRGI